MWNKLWHDVSTELYFFVRVFISLLISTIFFALWLFIVIFINVQGPKLFNILGVTRDQQQLGWLDFLVFWIFQIFVAVSTLITIIKYFFRDIQSAYRGLRHLDVETLRLSSTAKQTKSRLPAKSAHKSSPVTNPSSSSKEIPKQ